MNNKQIETDKKAEPLKYTIMTKEIRMDRNLSWLDKIIYSMIIVLCNKTGSCWAHNKYFMDDLAISKSTMIRAIKSLIKNGLIDPNYDFSLKNDTKRLIKLMPKNDTTDVVKLAESMDKNVATNQFKNDTGGGVKNDTGGGVKNDTHILQVLSKQEIKYNTPNTVVYSEGKIPIQEVPQKE